MNDTKPLIRARWTAVLPALALINIAVILLAIVARFALNVAPLSAFQFFFLGAQAGLGLGAAGVIMLLVGLVMKDTTVSKNGAATIVLGVLPLASAFALVGSARFSSPMIHDISTDLDDPPQFVAARSLRGPTENTLDHGGAELAAIQRQAYPDIAPIRSELNPEAAHARALAVIETLGWSLSEADPLAGRIEATETSTLYGFVDDVVIRIAPDGSGSRIDVRSVSRVGLGDVGANALRIRRFASAFSKPG